MQMASTKWCYQQSGHLLQGYGGVAVIEQSRWCESCSSGLRNLDESSAQPWAVWLWRCMGRRRMLTSISKTGWWHFKDKSRGPCSKDNFGTSDTHKLISSPANAGLSPNMVKHHWTHSWYRYEVSWPMLQGYAHDHSCQVSRCSMVCCARWSDVQQQLCTACHKDKLALSQFLRFPAQKEWLYGRVTNVIE